MTLQNQLDYLPTLLDGVSAVPAGIDADTLRSQIMLDCGLMTPLYSEPETMKAAIAHWFTARSWTFRHLVKIIEAEYSPVENYDRMENTTRNIASNRDISEDSSTRDNTTRSVEGDLSITQDVSAYNSSSYVDSQRSTTDDDQVISTDSESKHERKTDDDLVHKETTEGRIHGNIGVTTAFDLINGELALLSSFNLYEWIAREFASDLMLSIY